MTSDQRLRLGRKYLRLLRRTLVRIDRLSADLIEPHGLTNRQFLAMLLIRDNEGLTQVELADQLDSDQNTVSAMVRRLAARKLVTREPHPSDRRAVRLVVTTEGAALVGDTLPHVDRLSLTLESLVAQSDEAAIADWLERVADLHELE